MSPVVTSNATPHQAAFAIVERIATTRPVPSIVLTDIAGSLATVFVRDAKLAALDSPAPTGTASPNPLATCAAPNSYAHVLTRAPLDYPEIARQQGRTGTAVVKVRIDASGAVVFASIEKSTGNAALDVEARRSAMLTRYAPAIVNCSPVPSILFFGATFPSQ